MKKTPRRPRGPVIRLQLSSLRFPTDAHWCCGTLHPPLRSAATQGRMKLAWSPVRESREHKVAWIERGLAGRNPGMPRRRDRPIPGFAPLTRATKRKIFANPIIKTVTLRRSRVFARASRATARAVPQARCCDTTAAHPSRAAQGRGRLRMTDFIVFAGVNAGARNVLLERMLS